MGVFHEGQARRIPALTGIEFNPSPGINWRNKLLI
jgi:hypothetical protein